MNLTQEIPATQPSTVATPSRDDAKPDRVKMPIWFAIVFFCLAFWGVYALWSQVRFHSYRYGLNYLTGARLEMRPALKPVGSHQVGDTYEVVATLWNHGSQPIRVLGALADCSCSARRGLPATIPVGGSVHLPVLVRFGSTVGKWKQTIRFLTDDLHDPTVGVTLHGEVVRVSVVNTRERNLGGQQ